MGGPHFLYTVKNFWSFTYKRWLLILSALSIITLGLAIVLHYCSNENLNLDFYAGLFINLSTGFITGVCICIITGSKNKQSNKLNETLEYFKEILKFRDDFIDNYQKCLTAKKGSMRELIKANIYILQLLNSRIGVWVYRDYGQEAYLFQEDEQTLKLIQKLCDNSAGMMDCCIITGDLPGLFTMKPIEDIDFSKCIQSMRETNLALKELVQHAYEYMLKVEDKLEAISYSIF